MTVHCPVIVFRDRKGRVREGRATASRWTVKSRGRTVYRKSTTWHVDALVPKGYTW